MLPLKTLVASVDAGRDGRRRSSSARRRCSPPISGKSRRRLAASAADCSLAFILDCVRIVDRATDRRDQWDAGDREDHRNIAAPIASETVDQAKSCAHGQDACCRFKTASEVRRRRIKYRLIAIVEMARAIRLMHPSPLVENPHFQRPRAHPARMAPTETHSRRRLRAGRRRPARADRAAPGRARRWPDCGNFPAARSSRASDLTDADPRASRGVRHHRETRPVSRRLPS